MLNKSYSYLVPLVNEYCTISSDFVILLENTFVYNPDYEEDNLFTIMYEKSELESFVNYTEEIKANRLFKAFGDNGESVFFTINFPIEYISEYNLYKEGKFSKFSEKAKVTILNYVLDIHNLRSADRVRRVLYKDEELKRELEYKLALKIDDESELSSIPSVVSETFIMEKYGF